VPRFDRDPRAEGPLVQAVGPRGFTVDGGIYPGLLLTPVRAGARTWGVLRAEGRWIAAALMPL
jgi:uncharacterized protein